MKRLLPALFILIVAIGSTGYEVLQHLKNKIIISPLQPLPYQQSKPTFTPNSLANVIENALTGAKGTYGIAVKNLKTGESYYLNEHRIFEAASLYKNWVLAVAFDQIEKGNLKEEKILSQDIAVLNEKFNIASESAELTEGKISLTVKKAMEQMIIISHNYSALLLTERLRISSLSAFLKKHNLKESSVGQPPKTSAYDSLLFFEKLYQEEFVSKENTAKMLAIFKRQSLNSKLPKYLPKETLIAHKTGEIGFFTHDAGVVLSDKGDYIIAMLSESNFPSGAVERIAQISKAVYDYFTNKR